MLFFRRAIFILLSNVGGRVLFQETLESYMHGQDRMSMNKDYLSKLLAEEAYDAKGKFFKTYKQKGFSHKLYLKQVVVLEHRFQQPVSLRNPEVFTNIHAPNILLITLQGIHQWHHLR